MSAGHVGRQSGGGPHAGPSALAAAAGRSAGLPVRRRSACRHSASSSRCRATRAPRAPAVARRARAPARAAPRRSPRASPACGQGRGACPHAAGAARRARKQARTRGGRRPARCASVRDGRMRAAARGRMGGRGWPGARPWPIARRRRAARPPGRGATAGPPARPPALSAACARCPPQRCRGPRRRAGRARPPRRRRRARARRRTRAPAPARARRPASRPARQKLASGVLLVPVPERSIVSVCERQRPPRSRAPGRARRCRACAVPPLQASLDLIRLTGALPTHCANVAEAAAGCSSRGDARMLSRRPTHDSMA